MTAQELITAFEVFAEAPEGISRLRGFILELAVRGRLVPQQASEEDAKTLLARIAKEKKQLIKQKQAQRSKVSGSANPEDIPFELPVGWACCHFEDLHTQMGAGSTPKGGKKVYIDEGGYPFLRSQNIRNDGIQLDGVARIPSKTHQKMSRTIVRPHDVLLNITGASIGRSAVAPAEFAEANVSQHVAILRQVDPQTNKWVHLYLISPVGYRNIMDVQVGTSREGLSMTRLREFVIPIPPLAEQKRIFARVDELMALIGRLEAAKNVRDETRVALRNSALAALREADTPEEVEVAWNRVTVNLSDLVREPGDVKHLREVVLELAVRGKLVPQKPTEASATTLLGKRAQSHDSSDIPAGWAVSNLNSLGDVLSGGTPRKSNPNYWGGSIPWVSPKDMKRDFIGESIDSITEAAIEETSSKLIAQGALLMVVRGMILAHSFPTALTTQKVAMNQDMKALVPFDQRIAPYLLLATKGMKRTILEKVERSTHGTCKLPTGSLLNVPILIPPLAEQHRILERIDELTDLLDELQQRLVRQYAAHKGFAAAAVHHFEMEPSKTKKAEQLTLGLDA